MTSERDLEPRDKKILRALYEARFLNLDHIAALFFASDAGAPDAQRKAYQNAQQRVYKLRRKGYCKASEQDPFGNPVRISLTRQGFDYLRVNGLLEGYSVYSWETVSDRINVAPTRIPHETAVLDVRCRLQREAIARGLEVVEFATWPKLFLFDLPTRAQPDGANRDRSFDQEENSQGCQVKADGFLRLHDSEGEEGRYFLELDRATKVRKNLVGKILGHRLLQTSYNDLLAQRVGLTPHPGRKIAAPVLFVFQSSEDSEQGSIEIRNNAVERVAKETKIQTLMYAATFHDVMRDPFGHIWLRPKEYRAALSGTQYDPALLPERFTPVRRPGRDALIARLELVSPFG